MVKKETCSWSKWGPSSLPHSLALYLFSGIFKYSSGLGGSLPLTVALTFKAVQRNQRICLLFHQHYYHVSMHVCECVCLCVKGKFLGTLYPLRSPVACCAMTLVSKGIHGRGIADSAPAEPVVLFSNRNMHLDHLKILPKCGFCSVGLAWGLGVCISHKPKSKAVVASLSRAGSREVS